RLRLARESRMRFRSAPAHQLDRDLAIELGIDREIHEPHAAAANRVEHDVTADRAAPLDRWAHERAGAFRAGGRTGPTRWRNRKLLGPLRPCADIVGIPHANRHHTGSRW